MYTMNHTTAEGYALESKIAELKELEAMAKELETEIDAIKDEIKTAMVNLDTDELHVGAYTVRYTVVLTQRFDGTALKKSSPKSTAHTLNRYQAADSP